MNDEGGKMSKLRICNWNLNMGGDNKINIAPFIKDYLRHYDVLVLDEIVANEKLLETFLDLGEFDIYESMRDSGGYANQILIATKKELKGKLVTDHLNDDVKVKNPNLLEVRIRYGDEIYRVIGVRILSFSERELQKSQCEKIISYIRETMKADDRIIVSGDFNCGQLKGDSSKTYEEVKDLYECTSNGQRSSLVDYNWHIIKDLFTSVGMKLTETNGENKSWGISWKGNITYDGAKIKNDLVIVSEAIKALKSEYSWDFVRDHEEIYLEMAKQKRSGSGKNSILNGYPDHARLSIEVNQDKKYE